MLFKWFSKQENYVRFEGVRRTSAVKTNLSEKREVHPREKQDRANTEIWRFLFQEKRDRPNEQEREKREERETRPIFHFPFSLASWLAPFLVSPPQLVYGGEEHPFLLIAFLFDVFERERARGELELGFLLVRGKKDAYDEATQKHCVGSIFSFRSCQYFVIYLVWIWFWPCILF